MKLGIIGSGTIVQEFLPRLVKLEGLEIVGIQGEESTLPSVKALCEANGVALATASFQELVDAGIDTVYVAVPNFLHFAYCKQALEQGLHVIVEKPMTSNYKEACILKDLAKEKGCFLFEAITTTHLGNFHQIQAWLSEIGEIKLVQSQYSQYSRRYDAFQKGEILPVFDPAKSGGALMDLNLYNLHFVMGLFGMPKQATYYANLERGIDTSGVVMMNYGTFQAMCVAAKDCRGNYGAILQGTKGCIKTNYPPNLIGEVTLERNDGTVETTDDGMAMNRLIPEFEFFLQTVNNQDHAACDRALEESLAVSKVQTEVRIQAGIHFPSDDVC